MTGSQQRTFGILTFAGLGSLAAAELSRCDPSDFRFLRLSDHDLVLVHMREGDSCHLPGLRLAEDVFYMLGDPLPVRAAGDLSGLDSLTGAETVLEGLRLKNLRFHPPKPKTTTYNCFVKQDRDRQVRRKQMAARVNDLIGGQFKKWKQSDPAAVELWGFYVKETLHLGLRMSGEKMRYRGRKPPKRKGALRPTIAAALVYLADPADGELVVDPMCGSGTILQEGIAFNKRARYAGGDIEAGAVRLARESLAGRGVDLREWDATRLPLEPGSVDCFVCNLPFGRHARM